MNIKRLRFVFFSAISIFIMLSLHTAYAAAKDSKTTSYKIDVDFNEEQKTLTAVEVVNFTNNYEEDLNEIVFHLYPDSYNDAKTIPTIGMAPERQLTEQEKGDINIKKVICNGSELSFTENNQLLKIKTAGPVKNGDSIELVIDFSLKIPAGSGRLGYAGNVTSLTNWYPVLSIYDASNGSWDENPFHPIGESNYSDVSNYNVKISIPREYVVASTGVSLGETLCNDRKIVEIEALNVRDFVFMMSKDYKVVSKDIDGIKVNSYYTNDESKETAQRMLNLASDALIFFSDSFGKYPYPELDIVETYLSGGAMEYPQLIQMGRYPIQQDQADQYSSWLDQAIVHETCHQWWYVSVGNNEFKEPFMDESITAYSTAYFFEKKYGKYDKRSILMSIRTSSYGSQAQPFDSSVDKFSDMGDYNMTIYMKAPLVFEDLRVSVGEEKFLDIMRTYYKNYIFKNGTINDFLNVIKDIAGSDVKNKIKSAITSKDYDPQNLKPTNQEMKEINKIYFIESLKQREQYSGICPGSFLLRGIKSKKLYIITPDVMDVNYKNLTDAFIDDVKMYSDNMDLGIDFVIKSAKQMGKSDFGENLLLIGNMQNNDAINALSYSFPIELSHKGILMDDFAISSKYYSGYFIINNPNEPKNVILVISISNNLYEGIPIWYNEYQFDFKVNDKIEIKGKF